MISLRRLLNHAKAAGMGEDTIKPLMARLACCDEVVRLTNDHVAHSANPSLSPRYRDWGLTVAQVTEAQKALCEVAAALSLALQPKIQYTSFIPVPQYSIMADFAPWVEHDDLQKLWDFWHDHNRTVKGWIQPPLTILPRSQ